MGAEKDDTRKKSIVPGRVLLQFWSWLRPTSEQTTPQTRLVVMPAAAAVSPPVRMPMAPSSARAVRTPLASRCPKPSRNGGTAACKLGQRRVPPKGRKHHARHHIACQDAGGGQGGQVEKELAHHADGPACNECPEIVHVFPPFCSSGAASSTRCEMAGMLSFYKKVVWLISAPVARKRTRRCPRRSSRGRRCPQSTAAQHPGPEAPLCTDWPSAS